jgi:regulator of cell morphogenesis and NO signaling
MTNVTYDPKWDTASNDALIQHILTRYHQVHKQQFIELIELATTVESVHSNHPKCPIGLVHHLKEMETELISHMNKEEGILFPMLQDNMYGMAQGPISVMEQDHVCHKNDIQRILDLTGNITLPPGACNTWKQLYSGLAVLIADLDAHITLENEVLFNAERPIQVNTHGDNYCCGSCSG